jgi:galactose mutarotase-like enzyme
MPVFQLQNNLLSIKVNSFGAELCSVISSETNIEYIWQANETIWARHAPHLFPIVGKLKDGQYSYQDKLYQLPQHGFARDHEFNCIEESNDFLLFEFTANETTLVKYPFHFSLQIGYKLIGNKVEVNYSVFNPDSKELYFSIGAHPAFNCPLQKNESFNNYELVFPDKDKLVVNVLNDGLISNQTKEVELIDSTLAVSKELFNNDALVCMNSQLEEVSLVSKKTKHGVSLVSKAWPYYGIWSKKGTEQFVCLEPWHGIADNENTNGDFETKEGIIKIESEQYFKCSFDILFF